MDVFVDDYRALSDTDGIVADKSDSSLKVILYVVFIVRIAGHCSV